MSDETPQKRRRAPRKATPQYLENSAAHYLGRFASSKANLSRILMQKVRRSHQHHGTSLEEGEAAIAAIIQKFERLGYLNDLEYAQMRVRGLLAKGTPIKGLRFDLKRRGIQDDDIAAALDALMADENARDLDLAAATKLARRRRFGPFRSDDPDVRQARREKDLAAMARAGFSYDIALAVIDADTVEELELSIGM